LFQQGERTQLRIPIVSSIAGFSNLPVFLDDNVADGDGAGVNSYCKSHKEMLPVLHLLGMVNEGCDSFKILDFSLLPFYLSKRKNMEESVKTTPAVEQVREGANKLIDNIRSVIYIDRVKLEYIIAAKIAGGHVMLADSHGVGKTSLARALAGSISWEERDYSQEGVEVEPFNRIQCTVDLLPQDILGYTRIDTATSSLIFTRGPIFAHFVLCDEINLLTPKTQGSFFQAMEEQTVTIEGKTYHLEDPFS
jgi:hypothetical protein